MNGNWNGNGNFEVEICVSKGGIAMRKGVLIEWAEIPGNGPSSGSQSLTATSDEVRAFLALCLAACLLSVYAFAWATGAVSI
jgi:hypothetical protein